jgi:hypothetical protein
VKRILPGKPLPVRPAPRDLCRFLAKLVVGDVIPEGLDDPCWLWQGGTDKHGYGYFWFEGKCRWAHRYAFEAVKGPITRGEEIDHLCHNPRLLQLEPPGGQGRTGEPRAAAQGQRARAGAGPVLR